ncbi:hypothetical protein SAMN05444365_103261 [Micromonospora pattaloongensis]|uniref:Uncharacterized protein n=1 Tax=Micromonospora pattaloongensis TaxID=405436 RepID=A0A1H3M711_9ACTN|nr:hypothetical protein [Micromonospora pattaloongensis]SDY72517.1 hypothetical protein SAMN05444365_103261 [Micromonospora pattaloongensis]
MGVYLRLTITDTLAVRVEGATAVDPFAKITRTFWCRLPADWVTDGALCARRRESLVDRLYGPGWRTGDPDGSRYVILDMQEKVLSEREARARPWLGDRANFYVCEPDGTLRGVVPGGL